VHRMTPLRWLLVAGLAAVTLVVVLLDVTGVWFPAATPDQSQTAAPASSTPQPSATTASGAPIDLPLQPVDLSLEAPMGRALSQAVRRDLADPALGDSVSALVVDPTGNTLLRLRTSTPVVPASSLKLLTAIAVLQNLGAESRLVTGVVEATRPGEIVLVGGGDATLVRQSTGRGPAAPSSLRQLARQTAGALRAEGRSAVRLAYDDTAFVGPSISPAWEPTYVSSGVIAPVTALMVDQGLVDPAAGTLARVEGPAGQAASLFAAELKAAGIRVLGSLRAGTAPTGATVVAAVDSPPMDLLVERMLTDSDNQLAEALGRLAAQAAGRPASFTGAAATLRATAADAGISVAGLRVFDASGLSRDDRLTVETLTQCLVAAVSDDALRPVLVGLPVAGFSGTLVDRYLTAPSRAAAGVLRAKSGTLTGITAEAGLVRSADGGLRVFAVVADAVPYDTDAARAAIDDAVSRLAS